jgi:hypothetical protein
MAKDSRLKNGAENGVRKVISKMRDDNIPGEQKNSLEGLKNIIANEPVSRGKRKRAIKRARIESRKAFVAAAILSKRNSTFKDTLGSALGDFGDLCLAVSSEESIPNLSQTVKVKAKWPSGSLSRVKKLQSDQLDIERYRSLMNIPEFTADPIAAMERHLRNIKRHKEEKSLNRKASTMNVS